MKKYIYALLALMLVAVYTTAQEAEVMDDSGETAAQEASQKPEKPVKIYTPQAGDIGLSVDILTPIMTYVGNMFNDNTNNTFPATFSGPNYIGSVSISGRYFLYDDLALRAALSVDNDITITNAYCQDDAAIAADPLSVDLVTDTRTVTNNNLYLSFGFEFRRGYRRLQGYYGAQLIGAYQSQSTSYTYGNAITSLNQTPTQSFVTTPNNDVGGNSRLLQTNTALGKDYLIGLGGFVGVEYFILPKVAVGGEINISALAIFGGQQYEKSERYNTASGTVEENTRLSSPGDMTFVINTHNYGNGFYVSFYF